jgi:apolipoprotein D and lipocalin family protein
MLRTALIALVALAATGCARSTAHLPVAQPFAADRYLGTWYEQVRYDHSFERGLEAVSATYSRRDDGTIRVVNRGWNHDRQRWSEATGWARPADAADAGHLRVTFFWPFFGDYRIVHLDADYRTAIVTGPDYGWLWILTRARTIDEAERQALIDRAVALGFDRAPMLLVRHDRAPAPATAAP